jgi:hypothetical protein
MTEFISQTVLKRDLFSETHKGHTVDAPDVAAARRVVTAAPLWTRPLAWFLARREIRALHAVSGIEGTPHLIEVDRDGLVRTWTDGAPLHLARPSDPRWFADAFRLLRALRRAGVTHNDLAKPQNWLMTPDGRAAVIDFQLASCHRRRGTLFRLMAYEDFRHLLKQKRSFARHLMSPTAKRLLQRRSLPSRIWMATIKPLYNLVTRGMFHWSDGEGTGDRLHREGPAIRKALLSASGARDVALVTYALPKKDKGVGIYAFVETGNEDAAVALQETQRKLGPARADLIQPVPALPRSADGAPRLDVLNLIALNQVDGLAALLDADAALAATVRPIVEARLNFSDRRFKPRKPKRRR